MISVMSTQSPGKVIGSKVKIMSKSAGKAEAVDLLTLDHQRVTPTPPREAGRSVGTAAAETTVASVAATAADGVWQAPLEAARRGAQDRSAHVGRSTD